MAQIKYSRYYTYIKPIIENKLIRSSLPYIFSLVTIAILVVFAIRPTVSTILNLQTTIAAQQQTLAALNKKADDLTLARKNLEALGEDTRVKINTLVPQQANVTILTASLQNAAGKNASISALQIQPVTVIDNSIINSSARLSVSDIGFSYNTQGSFNQLLTILQNLNKSPRLMKIDSVVMSKIDGAPTTLSISGKAYYLK